MSTPSKFTADRRRVIVELLGAGASRRAAAAAARVDHATLLRWLRRGEKAAVGGRWRAFYEAVEEAERNPSLRVLERAQREMLDDPAAAWRFLQQTEPDIWRPERPEAPIEPGPFVIQLRLDGPPAARPRDESGDGDEEPEP